MRNLLTLLVLIATSLTVNAQLNCSNVNASISTTVIVDSVILTNNSTPSANNNIYTTYTIDWGDNSSSYVNNNNNLSHKYLTHGVKTIRLYAKFFDSLNKITCYDSTSVTVTIALNCNNIVARSYSWPIGNYSRRLDFTAMPINRQGLSAQYTIDWGDGNTTNTTVDTPIIHTYSSTGLYTVKLFATIYDSANNTTCVDSTSDIDTIMGSNPLYLCHKVQANFALSMNLGNINLYNLSTPGPGSGVNATYNIDWGDGSSLTTSSKTTHNHLYNTSGSYTIRLIANHSNSSNSCTDTITQSIQVATTLVGNIYGSVIADSVTTNDSIKVWLITYNTNTNLLQAIDSQIIPRRAGFVFTNVPYGQYRLKAHHINGPITGTGNIPTYHDSSLLWSNANIVIHAQNNTWNKNIYMKKGAVTNGPGFIGGNVNQGANKGTSSGIEGMTILLLDAGNNAIAFTNTDNNGAYEFSNIPVGTYTIHPENLGDATIAASITIAPGNTQFSGINFERSNSSKTIFPKPAGITNVNAATSYTVYPNPAHDVVNITWAEFSKDVANISITDISGKKVYSNAIQMNSNTAINVQNLQSGFYFLNVATENGSTTQKLVIE